MGALPLSFLIEERSHRRRPLDRFDLAITDDDPLDDDQTQFLTARRRGRGDRGRQFKDACPVGIERSDPIVVRQGRQAV